MKTIADFEHFVAGVRDGEVALHEIEMALQAARQSEQEADDHTAGEWQHIIVQLEDILADLRS